MSSPRIDTSPKIEYEIEEVVIEEYGARTLKTSLPQQQQQQQQLVQAPVAQDVEVLRVQLLASLNKAKAIVDAWLSKYSAEARSPSIVSKYHDYVSRIDDLWKRVSNAKTLDELNKLKQEVDALVNEVGKLSVDPKATAQLIASSLSRVAQETKDENTKKALQQIADAYSYLASTDPSTLRKDVALFYMLMDLARDDVYKQVYESNKESFQALLKVLAGSATYSDVEKAFYALSLIKQLKDQGLLNEKQVLDNYRYALVAGKASLSGLESLVAPGAGLVQAFQTLWQTYSGEVDKEVQQRLSEIESKISGGAEPEKRQLPIQLIAEATALVDPTRYIYNLAFNGVKNLAKMLGADENSASSIADKVASGVTGASSAALGTLVPPLGIAMALSAVLDTVSDIASRLASPIDKQLLLSYLQNHWQDLVVDTAVSVATGLATGYATAKLKPVIYNRIADALEKLGAKDLANKVRLSVGAPVEGGRGVVEATVREVPEEASIEYSYDPASGKMLLTIKLGGKTEVVDVNVPRDLANKFKAYARSAGYVSESPEATEIGKAFEAVFKLLYKSVKDRDKALQLFKDFANRVGVGDDVAVQTLAEALKSDVVGDAMLKLWSTSSTIYDNARDLCNYIERGGKAWRIAGTSDEASSLIRGLVMYDDENAMRMLVGKQAYLYTKTGEGTFLNTVVIEKYVPDERVFLALVEDLRRLFNAVKANIEVLKQVREHPEGGGLPPERAAQLLNVELSPSTTSILKSDPALRSYVETALMLMLRGVDTYPIIVYEPTTSFLHASLLVPASAAATAQSMVERGALAEALAKPSPSLAETQTPAEGSEATSQVAVATVERTETVELPITIPLQVYESETRETSETVKDRAVLIPVEKVETVTKTVVVPVETYEAVEQARTEASKDRAVYVPIVKEEPVVLPLNVPQSVYEFIEEPRAERVKDKAVYVPIASEENVEIPLVLPLPVYETIEERSTATLRDKVVYVPVVKEETVQIPRTVPLSVYESVEIPERLTTRDTAVVVPVVIGEETEQAATQTVAVPVVTYESVEQASSESAKGVAIPIEQEVVVVVDSVIPVDIVEPQTTQQTTPAQPIASATPLPPLQQPASSGLPTHEARYLPPPKGRRELEEVEI